MELTLTIAAVGLGQRGREGLDEPQRTQHGELDGVADVLKVVPANGFIDGTRNALLISTSTLPYAASVDSTRYVDLIVVGDVGREPPPPSPGVGDLLGDVVEAFGGARRQHQVGAISRASPCQRGAEARAHTTDHHYLVVEHPGHSLPQHPGSQFAFWRSAIRARQSSSEILLCCEMRQCGRYSVEVDELDGGAVGLGELRATPAASGTAGIRGDGPASRPSW